MIASSTSRPRDRINAPSEILCSPISNHAMKKNVTASTSGIETKDSAIRANRQSADRLDRVEGTAGSDKDPVGRRIERASCGDRVLCGEYLDDRGDVDTERRQLRIRQLDEDFLILFTDEVDF